MATIMKTAEYKLGGYGPMSEVTEFKKHLLTWAQNQATGQRSQAAMAVHKKVSDKHNAKSESFDFMVKYLQGLEIVSN